MQTNRQNRKFKIQDSTFVTEYRIPNPPIFMVYGRLVFPPQ